MIRTLVLTTLAAAAFAAPALAEQSAAAAPAETAKAQAAVLSDASGAAEARQHLIRQGYSNVSELLLEKGRWVGTALKDGKTTIVAIDLRREKPTIETN